MGIPILAMGFATLVVAPLVIVLLRLTKSGMLRYLGIALCSALFLFLFFSSFQYLLAATTQTGFDVEPEEIAWFQLPPEAKNISYQTRMSSTRLILEFEISKEKFTLWMKSTDRSHKAIVDPVQIYRLNRNAPNDLFPNMVTEGLMWDDYESQSDGGTTVVIDEADNRAHVRIQMW